MLSFINDKARFYIVAPANLASGGPELLHQLAIKLKQNGKNVSMYYIPANSPSPVHENYKEYNIDFVREVNDDNQAVLIVPETKTELLNDYKKIKKIVWWLSVDNYFRCLQGLRGVINKIILDELKIQSYFFFNSRLKSADFHLVQSEYARAFLYKKGINNVGSLEDYLYESFLKVNFNLDMKENLVVYNPKKGIKFTKKIMLVSPNINFVAIENMTRDEVVLLLKKAKVYIDFGNHPGKDRIPREAAILGCCVITNRRGSANFAKDLPIDDQFKFEENNSNLISIKEKIKDCLENYNTNFAKFESYRQEINQQEAEFDKQVRGLFT